MKRDRLVALCFLIAILAVPSVTLVMRMSGEKDNQQTTEEQQAILNGNGSMQDGSKGSEDGEETADVMVDAPPAQDVTAEKKGWFLELQDDIKDFTDDLFTRKELIEFNTGLTCMLSGNSYIENTQVLVGKEDYLFYKTEMDGRPIDDYMGINHFSEDELAVMAQNLVANRDYFAQRGIRLVIMGLPNKESVYSEYMPDTVYRIRQDTRADQVAEYLWANTDLEYIYPKKELMEAKDDYQVYYKTDTHWNQIGTFIGMQAMFERMYGYSVTPDTVDFRVDMTDYAGDLATIAGLTDKYNVDSVYVLKAESVDSKQCHDDDVLVVGDSFSGFVSTEAKAYYDEVTWKYTTDFTIDMVDEYQPDIIIWECTERYIERFRDVSLKDKVEPNL